MTQYEAGGLSSPHEEARTETSLARLEEALQSPATRKRLIAAANALTRSNDAHDPENLVQEVLLKAWTHREKYDSQKGLPITWMVHMMYNIFIDQWRKHARAGISVPLEEVTNTLSVQPNQISNVHHSQLLDLIEELPSNQQSSLLLSLQGFPHSEIAEILEIPIGTVKSRLRRAAKKLQVVE